MARKSCWELLYLKGVEHVGYVKCEKCAGREFATMEALIEHDQIFHKGAATYGTKTCTECGGSGEKPGPPKRNCPECGGKGEVSANPFL